MKKYLVVVLWKNQIMSSQVTDASSERDANDLVCADIRAHNEEVEADGYGMIIPIEKCRVIVAEL